MRSLINTESRIRIMGTGTFIHKVFSQTSQWQLEHMAGRNKYYVAEGKDSHACRPLHALHRSLCHLARHPHGYAHRNKMATLIVSSTCSTGACTTRYRDCADI